MLLYRRSAQVLFRSGRPFYGARRSGLWLTFAREEAGAPSLTGGSMTAAPSRLTGALLALLATTSLPALAAQVSDQDLLKDAETPDNVLTYGMGYKAQRYSPLDKINKDTVKSLVPAFAFSFGGEKQRGQESQPLVSDGTIYVTGSYSRLFAVDSRTGMKKWQYDARLPEGILPCCDVVNRGAALYKDKVYFTTLDAHLIALNQETGKVVWKKKMEEYKDGYSNTAAPLIVKGKVIAGNSGGEFGITGAVKAYDADTGEEVWARPAVEGNVGRLNGKPSTVTGTLNQSWPGDTWKTGGGSAWLGGTYDPELNLLYIGTSNPGPWNSWVRPGDNKWTSSTLAIDPDSGEIKWAFQTTPHDGWDFDGTNEFIPFELTRDGQPVKAGAKADLTTHHLSHTLHSGGSGARRCRQVWMRRRPRLKSEVRPRRRVRGWQSGAFFRRAWRHGPCPTCRWRPPRIAPGP